jgi:hypothetical protein
VALTEDAAAVIARADFLEYLDFQFQDTGKPGDEDALNHGKPTRGLEPRTPSLPWRCSTG